MKKKTLVHAITVNRESNFTGHLDRSNAQRRIRACRIELMNLFLFLFFNLALLNGQMNNKAASFSIYLFFHFLSFIILCEYPFILLICSFIILFEEWALHLDLIIIGEYFLL
jgi:hypothetical protein